VDRFQILEDLEEWLLEQHLRSCGYSYAESFTELGEPKYITAYSVTLKKLEELEYEHE
jgi:hypothetical protein